MRTFFIVATIAAAVLVYYNDVVKDQLQMWSTGGGGYHASDGSVTHGMASFGSSLGNSFEKMGKGISGN